MAENASTALLFFSRTATDEAQVKTFNPGLGKKGNIAIAKSLIDQSISTVNKTGLPIFTCYSSQQVGSSFGERLANAIESIFDEGFQKVIAIGNDCPDLTTSSLLYASKQLDNEQLVLGPSTDGGVYLIGIDRSSYKRNVFIELPWESSALLNSWKGYAKATSTNLSWLESLRDVDQIADFNYALKALPLLNKLKIRLHSILASYQSIYTNRNITFHTPISIRSLSLRAPPQ